MVPEDLSALQAGSDGVCGWLADGYHYSKTFGGKPKLVTAFWV
jgi:hypothetical protein